MKSKIIYLIYFCLLLSCGEKNTSTEIESKVSQSVEDSITVENAVPEEKNAVYFESTSPDASRATPLYEYIKIVREKDSVWGAGSGDFMQGSQPWTLVFSGKMMDENQMKLTITYQQQDEQPYTEEEIWTLDLNNHRLYRKNWAASDNDKGAEEYHQVNRSEIPKEHIPHLLP